MNLRNPYIDCANPQEVHRLLVGFMQELGLPYFSYLLVRRPYQPNTPLETFLLTNYPDEWQQRYAQQRYHLYDPVAALSVRSRLPFAWGSDRFLRPFRKRQRRVFLEGRDFKISQGYSIPVCGPDGDIGVFSVSGPRDADLKEVIRGVDAVLQLKAVEIHDGLMSQLFADENNKHITLSPRERECLLWTIEGKTAEDIAQILCVSSSTINYHLSNVIRKYGACNKHHAAIIAMRNGHL